MPSFFPHDQVDPFRSGAARAMEGSPMVVTHGGEVPGKPEARAYSHVVPRVSRLPVLIAVPHAGRAYPQATLAALKDPQTAQLRLEDRHVDRLAVAVARQTGAGLLVAHAPRALLDLNRAEDDIDWDMVEGGYPPGRAKSAGERLTGNRRSRSGLGLVPRRLPGSGDLWRGRLSLTELDARIVGIHRAYHGFLTEELSRIRAQWGAALLIDLHSMPPLGAMRGEDAGPAFVLGDRFGASCDGGLMRRALAHLGTAGWDAVQNRPYSGGYVLDRHGAPDKAVHALQVEVCRSVYLDRHLSEPSEGLARIADVLAGLVRELGACAARLGTIGEDRQAAE